MKIQTVYTFKHKQPLTLEKNVSTAPLADRYTLAQTLKNELTKPELRELKETKTEVIDCSEREFNLIPSWFLTVKGKLNFNQGKLI